MKTIYTIFLILGSIISFGQNIGIGLSNPTRAKLEVNGVVGNTSAIFGGEGTGISFQRDWPTVGFNQYYNAGSRYIGNGYAAVQFVDPLNGYMAIDMLNSGTANSIASAPKRAISILNSGNVGIRNGAGPASLWVSRGDAGNDGTAVFSGTSYNSHFNYSNAEDTYIRPGKNNGKVIINDVPGGKVAIGNGTTTKVSINNGADPQTTLEIRQANQTGIALIDPLANFNYWEFKLWNSPLPNPVALYFYYNGAQKSFIYYGGGEYVSVSDSRLKKNEQSLEPVLNKVMRLTPLHYQYKRDNPNNETSLGFFAQDVRPLFPELVKVVHGKGTGYNDI